MRLIECTWQGLFMHAVPSCPQISWVANGCSHYPPSDTMIPCAGTPKRDTLKGDSQFLETRDQASRLVQRVDGGSFRKAVVDANPGGDCV